MMDAYSIAKLVHILSATILVGTGLGTAFFLYSTHLRGDVRAIAAVSRSVVLADWIFTAPTIIVQPLTGAWLIDIAGYSWSEAWIIITLVLYIFAGMCWLPVVWLQIKIRDIAVTCAEGDELPALYHRYMRIWFVLGWPAFLAMAGIFVLMVFRPTL